MRLPERPDVSMPSYPRLVSDFPVHFDATFVRDLEGLFQPWSGNVLERPRTLVVNEPLAAELGIDPDFLWSDRGAEFLSGSRAPEGTLPVAMAYAGHQFGGYSPRLGDGRALLVGEFLDREGRRWDLHLKGSGRTPFARGGDGKAAVGPMMREFVIGEAMHALGIPTTRALAVVSTGENVVRETVLPGAVLARVAASHIRVGTFQYAASLRDPDLLRRLADHSIARHHPLAADSENPHLAFFESVVERQARLIARWMLVGFIHGVMNTDNMTISGETIDYGPCAFMDRYDPATVFSSIDEGGRYSYGNQPTIGQWNLARLAETLLPLLDPTPEVAVEKAMAVLRRYPETHDAAWTSGLRAKIGLPESTTRPDDERHLLGDLLTLLHANRVDYTSFFRVLGDSLEPRTDATTIFALRAMFDDGASFDAWLVRWKSALSDNGVDSSAAVELMRRSNPVYVPRNHRVEEVLAAATDGDVSPALALVECLRHPFTGVDACRGLESPAPDGSGPYRTFCGT